MHLLTTLNKGDEILIRQQREESKKTQDRLNSIEQQVKDIGENSPSDGMESIDFE